MRVVVFIRFVGPFGGEFCPPPHRPVHALAHHEPARGEQLLDLGRLRLQHLAELGAATLRLLELGDVPDRRHDTWLTLQHGGGAGGGGDGGGAGGGPSVRVCCAWAFKNAGKAKSSRQLLDGAASSDPLADARLVVAALRAQIAAQEERVDKLHGLFDALKGEFEPEYVTYCAKVAGYVTLTVGAATDLPAASAADHFVVVSHGAGCCATRPVARGDGWDETFELAIANTHEPLVISIKASAWPRAASGSTCPSWAPRAACAPSRGRASSCTPCGCRAAR